jgi:hypothetical protein
LPSGRDPGTLRPLGWGGEEEVDMDRMERHGDGPAARDAISARPRRAPEYTRCDACGEGMQSMGHCKWLCRACGFLRTCIDTV